DWDALYTSKTSAKMRSNDRRSERRLAQHGALRFRVAQTREERRRMLDSLVAQKSARFQQLGLPNFFDKPHIRAFYERLSESCDGHDAQSVFISALELDGACIAVNLGMTQGTSFHGMIVSMAGGAVDRFGPGRVLLRRSIEHLCREGFKEFDFGVGEDPYKDHWCDETVERPDVLVPLNAKGLVFVAALKHFLKTKAFIKQSPLLWRLFSCYRRYLGC
ncbi:MAG: GNAT family N-acetyltransferase, partial [Methyloligellaceae bacterium]